MRGRFVHLRKLLQLSRLGLSLALFDRLKLRICQPTSSRGHLEGQTSLLPGHLSTTGYSYLWRATHNKLLSHY